MHILHMGGFALCVAVGIPVGVAAQERTKISQGAFTISAPASISCKAPPDFILEGPAIELFSEDRSAVNTLVATMSKGLAQSCPEVESLTVGGEYRGVSFTFQVNRADDWLLDPSEVAEEPQPEPEQVAKKAPVPAAKTPEPIEPAKPAIKPGLSFEQFAGVFGSVPMVRGYAAISSNDTWSRVLAARVYAERPDLLNDDAIALELTERLLTPAEYQQFQGALAAKRPAQWSVFERRDLANRVRTQLKQGLDGRRQTGPINVYHSVPIQMGEYDFDKGAFPINSEQLRRHPQPQWKTMQLQGAFDSVVFPTELPANIDQARQLDEYLRQRNDPRLYLAVFVQVSPDVPPSLTQYASNQRAAPKSQLKQIALFADAGLTQILYDYTPVLAERQLQADHAAQRLAKPISAGEDFVRAMGTLNKNDAVANAMAQAYATSQATPRKSPAEVLAGFGKTTGPTLMTFSGVMQFGTYDPVRKVLPVQRFNAQHQQFQTMSLGFSINNSFFPEMNEIALTQEQANIVGAAVASGQQIEFRLEAELIAGSFLPQSPQYLQLNTTHRPHRLILFSGQSGMPSAMRTILLDLELPKSDSIVPSLIESLRIDK